jgi:ABC-type antimicrobial peptide transport system permease subunit
MLTAQRSEPYFIYYDELSPGKKFLMAGGIPTEEFFVYMNNKDNAALFKDRLEKNGGLTFPGTFDELVQNAHFYVSQKGIWQKVTDGRSKAVDTLKKKYNEKDFTEYLADPPETLSADFINFGFADGDVDLNQIYARAKVAKDLRTLNDLLRQADFRQILCQEMDIDNLNLNLDTFTKFYGHTKNQEKFTTLVKENNVDFPMSADRVSEILKDTKLKTKVMETEGKTLTYSRGKFGFSISVLWLIGVSFIVCIVGITNAMLMSVMERFREIATMKCLGATDSLVMSMFVFESCIQGIVGGFFGALLALVLSVSVAMLQYGFSVFAILPYGYLGVCTLIAMGIGVVLAALASVYPAYVASRLAPMEAMRLE